MEILNNAIGNIDTIKEKDNLALKSQNSPFALPFNFLDFYDEAATKKFIKATEKLIRTSREYKSYIELLRTNVSALNKDNILSNITTGDAPLEFHHYPFTLYEIVETVMSQHLQNHEKFNSFSLAKEVMELHYRHIIGLVPLTKTTHELAHSGNIFLSKNQVFGEYTEFVKEYQKGISADMRAKLTQLNTLSDANAPSDFKGLL